jgi:hypothetical protein
LLPSEVNLAHTNSQNEEDIAAALREQGISRQDVFITSKVSPYEQGTEKATLACQQILQRLQTDYVVRQSLAGVTLCHILHRCSMSHGTSSSTRSS